MTNTNKAGVQSDLDRGMAPLAYRIVLHGVYVMPYFVNPTAARKSGRTDIDIEVMKRLIPHAIRTRPLIVRPMVTIRHAWHIEHKSALGSCPDFSLIEALTPKRVNEADQETPSKSWSDLHCPTQLPKELAPACRVRRISLCSYGTPRPEWPGYSRVGSRSLLRSCAGGENARAKHASAALEYRAAPDPAFEAAAEWAGTFHDLGKLEAANQAHTSH